MPRYLIQGQYSEEGLRSILNEGTSQRASVLSGLIRTLGGGVEAFYYALGETDVFIILNLPDNVNAGAFSIAANASGLVKLRTTVLLSPEELDQATERAAKFREAG